MSEFRNQNQLRPVANPEQEQAYVNMTSVLFKEAYTKGKPINVFGVQDGTVQQAYEDFFEGKDDVQFTDHGRLAPLKLTGADGNPFHGTLYMFNEEGVANTGLHGSLVIYDKSLNSHPANIFLFHPDSNVEFLRRELDHDGRDDEGYHINPRDVVTHIGWLDAEGLGAIQETFER